MTDWTIDDTRKRHERDQAFVDDICGGAQTTDIFRDRANLLAKVDKLQRKYDALKGRTCEWTPPTDCDDDCWNASCGAGWTFMEDGPEENNMNYCPECGGKLVIRALLEDLNSTSTR